AGGGRTEEERAEQAGLSLRSVSDLERGINRAARKDRALMLASALKLTGLVQEAFVAAARGRAEPARVLAVRSEAAPESSAAAATRTLPRDIGGFTGRERELTGLEKSLAQVAGRWPGGHLRDRRDGWHWQDDVRRARRAPARRALSWRAVLPPAARAHRWSVTRRPGRRPGESADDGGGGCSAHPAWPGSAGSEVAR